MPAGERREVASNRSAQAHRAKRRGRLQTEPLTRASTPRGSKPLRVLAPSLTTRTRGQDPDGYQRNRPADRAPSRRSNSLLPPKTEDQSKKRADRRRAVNGARCSHPQNSGQRSRLGTWVDGSKWSENVTFASALPVSKVNGSLPENPRNRQRIQFSFPNQTPRRLM